MQPFLLPQTNPLLRSYAVYRRGQRGVPIRIGIVRATNHVQADTKARNLYRSASVWTKLMEDEDA